MNGLMHRSIHRRNRTRPQRKRRTCEYLISLAVGSVARNASGDGHLAAASGLARTKLVNSSAVLDHASAPCLLFLRDRTCAKSRFSQLFWLPAERHQKLTRRGRLEKRNQFDTVLQAIHNDIVLASRLDQAVIVE